MATDAMLQALTSQIFSALSHHAQFAIDFRDHFEAMKTKLELMQAFLSSTADNKSREKDVQKYLSVLRKLIYEADDILADCQIRDEYHKEGSCWSNSSPRRLLFRYKTGKKLAQINLRIQGMESSLTAYRRSEQPIYRGNNPYRAIGYSSQDYDPSEIIGLEKDMEKIKGWIFSSNEELNGVGIVGMGGLGKTTLAQKIFNDREVATHFEVRIWLSLSQDCGKDQIMRAMLRQLGHDAARLDESNLLRVIHRTVGDKTCLIVMDDVWDRGLNWWSELCPTSKSILFVITSRDEDVTRTMGVADSRIHRPKALDEEESWSLFSKFAFLTSKGKCPNVQFEREGRDILEKCGGLPLAIKTVGGLLAPKIHSLGEWKKVNDNFHKLTTEGQNKEVMASLQLSYDDLPSYLKQCLLCFSIYPEDFKINGEQIVHWWIGEGLIQDTENATELGFQYLSDLVSRCLVEVVHRRGYDGRVYSCRMHDLVRDMTIKIAKDEAFCSFDGKGKPKLRQDTRWLGFTSDMNPRSLKNSTKLRALIMMSSDIVPLNKNVELLNSLRVLDFSDIKLDNAGVEYLWKWICSLKRLANLNLSGVSGVKEVPSSVKKLRNLRILVLRKCNNLAKIHQFITILKMLIMLDLGSCPMIKCLPDGLGKLFQLQELTGFRVLSRQSCQFHELLNLKQLRVLGIHINSESEISADEWDTLSQLEKLQVLAIDAEDCKEKRVAEILNQLSPPPMLKEFYLKRYRHETLPKWMNSEQLSHLQYLCLEDGDVVNFETGSEAEDSNAFKWKLEGICLKFMQVLDLDWEILVKDMPFLRYAEISSCFNLKNSPSSDKLFVWKKNQNGEITIDMCNTAVNY